MNEKFTAPCVGGPQEGAMLPYTFAYEGVAMPEAYWVWHESANVVLGKYVFVPACEKTERFTGERAGTGDTWRWHPFIGSIK